MIESLDLSVPVGGSGMFIQLHQNNELQKVQPLWTKYCRLQKRIDSVHESLGLCNDHAWLLKFAEECRRQNKYFEKELRLLANSLEESKIILERQIGEVRSKMAEVDPALSRVSHTLANPRTPYAYEASCFASKKSEIAVLKRNAVVAKYSHLRSVSYAYISTRKMSLCPRSGRSSSRKLTLGKLRTRTESVENGFRR